MQCRYPLSSKYTSCVGWLSILVGSAYSTPHFHRPHSQPILWGKGILGTKNNFGGSCLPWLSASLVVFIARQLST